MLPPTPDPRARCIIDARACRGCRSSAELTLRAVRWSLRFPLSHRELERMLADRGVKVDHVSLDRKPAARRFFRRALGRANTRNPREIVTDRLKSYPGALRDMKRDGELWSFARHRRGRWLNNRVEQDHHRVKRRTRPMLGFQSFRTAWRTLAGVEAMAMLVKGQVRAVPGNDMLAQGAFVQRVFGLAA